MLTSRVAEHLTRGRPVDSRPSNSIAVGVNNVTTLSVERPIRPSRFRCVIRLSSRQKSHIPRMRVQSRSRGRSGCKRSHTSNRSHHCRCHCSPKDSSIPKQNFSSQTSAITPNISLQWPSAPHRAFVRGCCSPRCRRSYISISPLRAL